MEACQLAKLKVGVRAPAPAQLVFLYVSLSMAKITSPQDLISELQGLLDYCSEGKPSRAVLASKLDGLADRVFGKVAGSVSNLSQIRNQPFLDVTYDAKDEAYEIDLWNYAVQFAFADTSKEVDSYLDRLILRAKEAKKKALSASKGRSASVKVSGMGPVDLKTVYSQPYLDVSYDEDDGYQLYLSDSSAEMAYAYKVEDVVRYLDALIVRAKKAKQKLRKLP